MKAALDNERAHARAQLEEERRLDNALDVVKPRHHRRTGEGTVLLDVMKKDYIRTFLSYRFVVCSDGAEALAVERAVRAGELPADRPLLNPFAERAVLQI